MPQEQMQSGTKEPGNTKATTTKDNISTTATKTASRRITKLPIAPPSAWPVRTTSARDASEIVDSIDSQEVLTRGTLSPPKFFSLSRYRGKSRLPVAKKSADGGGEADDECSPGVRSLGEEDEYFGQASAGSNIVAVSELAELKSVWSSDSRLASNWQRAIIGAGVAGATQRRKEKETRRIVKRERGRKKLENDGENGGIFANTGGAVSNAIGSGSGSAVASGSGSIIENTSSSTGVGRRLRLQTLRSPSSKTLSTTPSPPQSAKTAIDSIKTPTEPPPYPPPPLPPPTKSTTPRSRPSTAPGTFTPTLGSRSVSAPTLKKTTELSSTLQTEEKKRCFSPFVDPREAPKPPTLATRRKKEPLESLSGGSLLRPRSVSRSRSGSGAGRFPQTPLPPSSQALPPPQILSSSQVLPPPTLLPPPQTLPPPPPLQESPILQESPTLPLHFPTPPKTTPSPPGTASFTLTPTTPTRLRKKSRDCQPVTPPQGGKAPAPHPPQPPSPALSIFPPPGARAPRTPPVRPRPQHQAPQYQTPQQTSVTQTPQYQTPQYQPPQAQTSQQTSLTQQTPLALPSASADVESRGREFTITLSLGGDKPSLSIRNKGPPPAQDGRRGHRHHLRNAHSEPQTASRPSTRERGTLEPRSTLEHPNTLDSFDSRGTLDSSSLEPSALNARPLNPRGTLDSRALNSSSLSSRGALDDTLTILDALELYTLNSPPTPPVPPLTHSQTLFDRKHPGPPPSFAPPAPPTSTTTTTSRPQIPPPRQPPSRLPGPRTKRSNTVPSSFYFTRGRPSLTTASPSTPPLYTPPAPLSTPSTPPPATEPTTPATTATHITPITPVTPVSPSCSAKHAVIGKKPSLSRLGLDRDSHTSHPANPIIHTNSIRASLIPAPLRRRPYDIESTTTEAPPGRPHPSLHTHSDAFASLARITSATMASLPSQLSWQTSESGIAHQQITETANKRISTLDYMRKAHEGRIYWFNTYLFEKSDLARMPYFDPRRMARRATNYLLLGLSLPAVVDLNSGTPLEFLRSLNTLLSEFESYQQLRGDGSSGSGSGSGVSSSLSRARLPQMFRRAAGAATSAGRARRAASTDVNMYGSASSASGAGGDDGSSGLGSFGGIREEDTASLSGGFSGHSSGNNGSSTPTPAGSGMMAFSASEVDLLPGEEYTHLMTPSLPFEPDFFETFATLCDVLIDCYTRLLTLVPTPRECTSPVSEQFTKADAKIRKIVIANVVKEFEDASRAQTKAELASIGKAVLGGLI